MLGLEMAEGQRMNEHLLVSKEEKNGLNSEGEDTRQKRKNKKNKKNSDAAFLHEHYS